MPEACSWPHRSSRLSALGSRLSALGSRLSALGSRLSALGSRLSALGSRLSALGSRLSALGSRLSALGSRLSALGSRLSALGSRLSALGSRLSRSLGAVFVNVKLLFVLVASVMSIAPLPSCRSLSPGVLQGRTLRGRFGLRRTVLVYRCFVARQTKESSKTSFVPLEPGRSVAARSSPGP